MQRFEELGPYSLENPPPSPRPRLQYRRVPINGQLAQNRRSFINYNTVRRRGVKLYSEIKQKNKRIYEYKVTDDACRYADDLCTICIDSFKDDSCIVKSECGHLFHKECMQNWLNTCNSKELKFKCPNCNYCL